MGERVPCRAQASPLQACPVQFGCDFAQEIVSGRDLRFGIVARHIGMGGVGFPASAHGLRQRFCTRS